jgi:hypothetical protein
MTKPDVRKLLHFGPLQWWCLTADDAAPFATWSEAMAHALLVVSEPTA